MHCCWRIRRSNQSIFFFFLQNDLLIISPSRYGILQRNESLPRSKGMNPLSSLLLFLEMGDISCQAPLIPRFVSGVCVMDHQGNSRTPTCLELPPLHLVQTVDTWLLRTTSVCWECGTSVADNCWRGGKQIHKRCGLWFSHPMGKGYWVGEMTALLGLGTSAYLRPVSRAQVEPQEVVVQ